MSGVNFSYVDIWIFGLEGNDKACANISRGPWESIAENVWPDVLSACNFVKNEMKEKPTMVARFGKLVFKEYVIWFHCRYRLNVLS